MIRIGHRYLLLTFFLAVSLIVIVSLTDDDSDADSGTEGTISWDFTDGTLTYSGEGYVKQLPPDVNKSQIKKLVFNEGITKIGLYSFRNMKNLKEIYLPKTLSDISYDCFVGLPSLEYIYVDSSNTHYKSESGILYNADMTALYRYPAGKQNAEYIMPATVTKIDSNCFDNNSQLERIRLSPNLTAETTFLNFKAGDVRIEPETIEQCKGYSIWISLKISTDTPKHVKQISNGYDIYRFSIEGIDHFDTAVRVSIPANYLTVNGRSAYLLPEEGDRIEHDYSTSNDRWHIKLDRSAYFALMAEDFHIPLDAPIMIVLIIAGTCGAVWYIRRNRLL